MEIHTLEALSDNYMYLIVDASTRAGAVVDPADPDVVMEAVQRLGVTLTHVLTHADTYVPASVLYVRGTRTGLLRTVRVRQSVRHGTLRATCGAAVRRTRTSLGCLSTYRIP